MPDPVAAFVHDPDFTLYLGDVRDVLSGLADESVDCCVTSPPYLGLRDYGVEGQIGLEPTIGEYVAALVGVFAQVRRLLKPTGTLWLNLGDSYNAYNGGAGPGSKLSQRQTEARPRLSTGFGLQQKELKPKDLMMVPARTAIALCDDGWYLRSEILWCKPNGMVESITDRPTRSSERIYLLAKNRRYYFGQDDLRQPFKDGTAERYAYAFGGPKNEAAQADQRLRTRPIGKRELPRKAAGTPRNDGERWNENNGRGFIPTSEGANIRDWWPVPVEAGVGDHYAVMPQEIARRCILGGCPPGGVVLDPFMGAGTTALAARALGRRAVGVELNPSYAELSAKRLSQQSLLAGEAVA